MNMIMFLFSCGIVLNMLPHQARGCVRPLLRARWTHRAGRARGEHEKGDGENHHESVIGGGANASGGNVGGNARSARGAPPVALSGAEFMQGMFTAIEQVVRNIVDWLEQVTRALNMILVAEEDLQVLFALYQLQGDAL